MRQVLLPGESCLHKRMSVLLSKQRSLPVQVFQPFSHRLSADSKKKLADVLTEIDVKGLELDELRSAIESILGGGCHD